MLNVYVKEKNGFFFAFWLFKVEMKSTEINSVDIPILSNVTVFFRLLDTFTVLLNLIFKTLWITVKISYKAARLRLWSLRPSTSYL